MKLSFSPVRSDDCLTLHRAGDVLTINGVPYDFSPLRAGDTLPRAAVDCAWLASDVTRAQDAIALTLILPHGASAPEATRFPASLVLTADGPVDLPPHDTLTERPDEH